ncbi:tetratricopeptide repeat protein [Streptomyces uncialis]|uniref:tetratricopeptide repeat protein n=1 Tax=Streptomyces uncialis TaxID=1048205 RepID=UPI0033D72E3F
MSNQTRLVSAEELESIFQRELATDRWAAAETSYALAVRHRDLGDWPASREWVEQCLRLLEGFPSETEEQVAVTRTSVGGVPLPTYLHSGVVKGRFGDLT